MKHKITNMIISSEQEQDCTYSIRGYLTWPIVNNIRRPIERIVCHIRFKIIENLNEKIY